MIVADTHAWLWWVSDARELSAAAREALTSDVAVSPITFWELAMLDRKRRLSFDRPIVEWLDAAVTRTGTIVLPLTIEICALAGGFSDPLRDPADRIIVATALHHGAALVTRDDRIHRARIIRAVW